MNFKKINMVSRTSAWHDYNSRFFGTLSRRNVMKEVKALRESPNDEIVENKKGSTAQSV